MPEDSISGIPTGSSEDSRTIQTPQVPTVFVKSTHDESDSSITKPMTEFESPQENGEQITVVDNSLLSTNQPYSRNSKPKVKGLITYSLDQQIFKFKVNNGHKEPQETSITD